jgi:tetratricopeptide (TPR) repeat protein
MKTLLFLLLSTAINFSAPYEPSALDKQIINFTFNEDFEQAKKLAQEQIRLNPSSPKYYYYYINTKILEYYQKVAELSPWKRDEGRKILNKEIIDYCENVVGKFEKAKLDTENKFYFGSIYGYLGRIYGIDGSWWSAFRTGLKSRNLMEEILKDDAQFYDAYLVLGMLYYYADRLSGLTGFIASVLGMSGDREKGLNYLQMAYDRGALVYGQTALTLIEVYSSLEDNDVAAFKYYTDFLKKYPRSKRALNSYCQRLLGFFELGKVTEIIKSNDQSLFDNYTFARYHDLLGNSETAIKFAESALKNENTLWRGASNNARYIIVFNSWLTGNSTKVKKYESELDERNKENFGIVKKYEKESKWLREFTINIANSKSVSELEAFAQSKPNLKNAEGYENRFNSLMGLVYYKNKMYDKAEQYYRKCLSSNNDRDKYTAYKFLVDIYLIQSTDKNKVKKLLDNIDDLDNDRLTFRAKDLEKKYNL